MIIFNEDEKCMCKCRDINLSALMVKHTITSMKKTNRVNVLQHIGKVIV